MIRYLTISFLVSLFFVSCSLKTTEGLRQVHFNETEVENPYFLNPEIDYVYKAKIAIYKKNFGGILIIKKIGPESHRVVFTTEFGSKLFDFQFEGDTFTKHFVVEDLDKKFIAITVVFEEYQNTNMDSANIPFRLVRQFTILDFFTKNHREET